MAKPTPEEKAEKLLQQLDERMREARGVLGDLYALKRDVEKDLTAKVQAIIGTSVDEGLQELAGEISNLREHIIATMDAAVRRELDLLVTQVGESPMGKQLFTVAASIQAMADKHAATGMKHELTMDLDIPLPAIPPHSIVKSRRR